MLLTQSLLVIVFVYQTSAEPNEVIKLTDASDIEPSTGTHKDIKLVKRNHEPKSNPAGGLKKKPEQFAFIPRHVQVLLKAEKSENKYRLAFSKYIQEFSKKYNAKEKKKRYKIFRDYVKRLEKFKTQVKSSQKKIPLDLDYFADMSELERKKYIEKKKTAMDLANNSTVLGKHNNFITISLDPFNGMII